MPLQLTFPAGSAFVAGGTGNVGAGVVATFAEAGLLVTFTYRSNEAAATRLVRSLGDRGFEVMAVRMEMQEPESIDAALDEAEAFGGPLRTVACTSGAQVPFNRIADFDVGEVESYLAGDAGTYYRLLHRVVPRLRANGGGSITVTTTIATQRVIAYDGLSAYSKGAVQALVRQIAAEEAEHGIRCNDVAIGLVTDASVDDMVAVMEALPSPTRERFGALISQLRGLLRLGRVGTPAEAGMLFAFLASEQAAFVTGQQVAIDGGISL
jgi:NAD(P)-dependent dehydrogenase (short-subunit alcohol dehydrogenase family)